MITDLTWNEFCERYYETARQTARIYLERQRKKLGGFHRMVDEDYVRDSAVLAALEKTYQNYNATRGVKITTFLSRIIHNEIVDELKRESKDAARKDDLEALRKAVQTYGESPSEEKREQLLARMTAAIRLLSPSDQIILNYYLEDQSTYVENSVKELGVTPNYVSVRRIRIFSLLPKLMNLSREQYAAFCYDSDDTLRSFHSRNIFTTAITSETVSINRSPVNPITQTNPINPALDPAGMAMKVLRLVE